MWLVANKKQKTKKKHFDSSAYLSGLQRRNHNPPFLKSRYVRERSPARMDIFIWHLVKTPMRDKAELHEARNYSNSKYVANSHIVVYLPQK
jgi:hypothetical protein